MTIVLYSSPINKALSGPVPVFLAVAGGAVVSWVFSAGFEGAVVWGAGVGVVLGGCVLLQC